MAEKGWDNEANEVQSNWMKFNKPMEDKIHGTLIGKRRMKSQMANKEGEMQNVYDMKADEPSVYHNLDEKKKLIEEAQPIKPGDIFAIGGTTVLDRQMQNIKVGQIIGIKYIEETPSKTKGYNPAKVIKVYVVKGEDGEPLMDTEFLATAESENF